MDLFEIVTEMEAHPRHPDQIIKAHRAAFDTMKAIADRLVAAEARIYELETAATSTDENTEPKRGPGRPRKTAE
jgi:hypothetical protein